MGKKIRIRVLDPDSDFGFGSGMNNLDQNSGSLEIIFWVKICTSVL
jgi:hypothetical protein